MQNPWTPRDWWGRLFLLVGAAGLVLSWQVRGAVLNGLAVPSSIFILCGVVCLVSGPKS